MINPGMNSISPINTLPSQMLPYRDKVKNKKKWAKECVDVFDQIARRQLRENYRFVENYQMINGKFMPHHYYDDGEHKDLVSLLTKEFDMPSTLRHYDIISKLVNNLTEKLNEFPDIFRVQEQYEEDENNEYIRSQTEFLHQSIKAEINTEIEARLAAEGIDVNKNDFASEEEAMQYFKEVEARKNVMTPPQIQKYMATEWQGQAEIWGQHQLNLDRERYKLNDLERVEYKDMLVTDMCLRHWWINGDGYDQETWNPVNSFFHVSDEGGWVQDGNYAGRRTFMSKSDIFERFGWKMKDTDIKKFEEIDTQLEKGKDFNGFPYNAYVPFQDYKSYDIITRGTGWDPINNLPVIPTQDMLLLEGNSPINRHAGLYSVLEVYWKSQRKIGKAVYEDEDGLIQKDLVDEDFIVPDDWEEKKGDFMVGNHVNCVYWTYITQVWQGTKISLPISDADPVYLDLKPCEFQFKGDYNPFGAKLPVCGRIFNRRNAQSMSFVDMCKPNQIGYNMMMNQMYQAAEKEIGKFMVWDVNFLNTMKDWGGEDAGEKVMLIAKELGHVFGDSSNPKANPNSGLPKEIDMDLTAYLLSRAKLAEFFENRMMGQLGISQQFLGDVNATDTATGVKTGVKQSNINVQKYYTDFFEYKQQCLTMDLDIAQYTQSLKKDVTITYTKSDASRAFIRLAGTSLLLKNMHVYVVNSQELLRQLEMIRNLFLNNNTTQATELDLVEVITNNSPSAIKAILEVSVKKREALQQAQIQQAQALQQQQIQADQAKEQIITDRGREANETKKEVAYITTFNKTPLSDANANTIPDSLEYSKFAEQQSSNAAKNQQQTDKNNLARQKLISETKYKTKDLALKEKQLKQKAKESADKVKIAKTNKNKFG